MDQGIYNRRFREIGSVISMKIIPRLNGFITFCALSETKGMIIFMDGLILSNMRNSINQLKIIYNKHEELQKQTGEKFNIFSILNMERFEVRTHSAFLYELLNPKGSHY